MVQDNTVSEGTSSNVNSSSNVYSISDDEVSSSSNEREDLVSSSSNNNREVRRRNMFAAVTSTFDSAVSSTSNSVRTHRTRCATGEEVTSTTDIEDCTISSTTST